MSVKVIEHEHDTVIIRLNKKWLILAAVLLFSAAVAGMLITKAASASGWLQIQVNIAPFQWKVNNQIYSSSEKYNNGKHLVPSSLNYEGTAYIPIRLLAETLGYQVDWDAVSRMATVTEPANPDDPVPDLPNPAASASANKFYINKATLTASTPLLAEPTNTSSVKQILLAGTNLSVLEETSSEWVKVTDGNELWGYLSPDATDFIYKADRPTWERKADEIMSTGLQYLGTEYEFDADLGQTDTFDCSSFMNYIFAQNGYSLPRNSRQQSKLGTIVELQNLRKGDLLFFTTPKRKNNSGVAQIGHVAMYAGDNHVLQTYRVGIGVTLTELDEKWLNRIIVVKRLIQ